MFGLLFYMLSSLSYCWYIFSSIKFSQSVMSDSLQPHGLQLARPPCPSPTPGAYSDSCPLSGSWHPIVSSSVVPFSSHLQSFPASKVFFSESVLCIRWPKYWSFSFCFSPSNEYSGLVSFRMDWLDLLAVQGNLKSLLQHQSSKASIFSAQLSSVQFLHPSMSSSNCCFLTSLKNSYEAVQVVWYSQFLKNFPQFVVIHTVKGFGIVNKGK